MNKPKILWVNALLFSITGLIALIGVPWYGIVYGFDGYQVLATILCMGYCGMSITAGYHRLWSHPTYKTNIVIRVIYAIGGAFALQNSALHWSSDHRVHHKFVDNNDKDPYSAKKGFWYSHIGWMLRDYHRERYEDYSNVQDLQKDPVVMWQHRNYLLLTIITNVGIPLAIGIWNGDIWGSLLIVGVLRLVLSQHVTFFINSLAHLWGRQPYTDKNTAKDNALLAYFTFGEGYHNYHHCFQMDYRNGILWWQFDPTKWLIWGLSKLGLANGLRRCGHNRIEKAKAVMSLKKANEKLTNLPNADEVRERLQAEFDCLIDGINKAYEARKVWLETKKSDLMQAYEKSEAMQQYNELKANLQEQRERWQNLVTQYA